MERLGVVHGFVGGDQELVEGFAVRAVGRRPDADADARVVTGAHAQGEFRDGVFDAVALLFDLLAVEFLDDGDELVARVARQKIVFA